MSRPAATSETGEGRRSPDAPPTRSQRKVGLFVVVANIRDAKRRKNVYDILGAAGQRVGVGAYEVALTRGAMRRLLGALGEYLSPDDRVRCYPVCAKCQKAVRMHGGGRLASLPLTFLL